MLDEKRRHRLMEAFNESHGEEVAVALAESIFSTEVATKADLKALEARLDARIDNCATKADLKILEERIGSCATKADLEATVGRQLKWLVATLVGFLGFLVAVAGVVTAVIFRALEAIGS